MLPSNDLVKWDCKLVKAEDIRKALAKRNTGDTLACICGAPWSAIVLTPNKTVHLCATHARMFHQAKRSAEVTV